VRGCTAEHVQVSVEMLRCWDICMSQQWGGSSLQCIWFLKSGGRGTVIVLEVATSWSCSLATCQDMMYVSLSVVAIDENPVMYLIKSTGEKLPYPWRLKYAVSIVLKLWEVLNHQYRLQSSAAPLREPIVSHDIYSSAEFTNSDLEYSSICWH
jgi:hypothetical protein